eukprot:CAMPEP_0182433460 /NCGR_PEP_ID=MMETSP1167-20130531/63377_1 /TAXON_ID=2988 /ORGANISM="Mallomonas Sp, Strain CCMP3275" /LENGTH=378 /DNA_ID=CAMNT_0024622177 /DNA_START=1 /DNA_END=1137 /DNA_ORIENTATION=-
MSLPLSNIYSGEFVRRSSMLSNSFSSSIVSGISMRGSSVSGTSQISRASSRAVSESSISFRVGASAKISPGQAQPSPVSQKMTFPVRMSLQDIAYHGSNRSPSRVSPYSAKFNRFANDALSELNETNSEKSSRVFDKVVSPNSICQDRQSDLKIFSYSSSEDHDDKLAQSKLFSSEKYPVTISQLSVNNSGQTIKSQEIKAVGQNGTQVEGGCSTLVDSSMNNFPLSSRNHQSLPNSSSSDKGIIPELFDLHVLVVEDSAASRKMECRLIQSRCAFCSEAHDGQQAVDRIQSMLHGDSDSNRVIDVILMDSEMPILDGLQATKSIRDMGFSGVIIGVTGNVTRDEIETFLESGADAVLPKPLEIQSFVIAINSLLNNT